MPHSEFLAWDAEDQDKALAWQIRRADRCPGCGLQLADTTGPDNLGRHTADVLRCHACAAVEHGQADAYERNKGAGSEGLHWFATEI